MGRDYPPPRQPDDDAADRPLANAEPAGEGKDAPLKNKDASADVPPAKSGGERSAKAKGARSVRKPPLITIRSTPPKKGDWLWWFGGFVAGFVIGLALSLTYGWILDPRPEPVSPAHLQAEEKGAYMRLIALAYAHNQDLAQARERLAAFELSNVERSVADLTEIYIEQERDIRDVRALVALSDALGQATGMMAVFIVTPTPPPTNTPTPAPTPTPRPTQTPTSPPTNTPTPTLTPSVTPRPTRTPTVTNTPTPTRTPRPTRTPTATRTPTPGPNAPFGVVQSAVQCNVDANNEGNNVNGGGLLRVYVRDRLGDGLPGVSITVWWPGGRDTFFTGFKPDVDPGYADFQMEPGLSYEVELTDLDMMGQPPEVTLNNQAVCPGLPADVAPSWQVIFQQGAGR